MRFLIDAPSVMTMLTAARRALPNEGCGYGRIARSGDDIAVIDIVALALTPDHAARDIDTVVATTTRQHFALNGAAVLAAASAQPIFWWHSHPSGPLWPSAADRAALAVDDLLVLCHPNATPPARLAAFICTTSSVRQLAVVVTSHRAPVGPECVADAYL